MPNESLPMRSDVARPSTTSACVSSDVHCFIVAMEARETTYNVVAAGVKSSQLEGLAASTTFLAASALQLSSPCSCARVAGEQGIPWQQVGQAALLSMCLPRPLPIASSLHQKRRPRPSDSGSSRVGGGADLGLDSQRSSTSIDTVLLTPLVRSAPERSIAAPVAPVSPKAPSSNASGLLGFFKNSVGFKSDSVAAVGGPAKSPPAGDRQGLRAAPAVAPPTRVTAVSGVSHSVPRPCSQPAGHGAALLAAVLAPRVLEGLSTRDTAGALVDALLPDLSSWIVR